MTRFKVCLTSYSLRAALSSADLETDEVRGNMVSQWMHRENLDLTYVRWQKGEVGLVVLDNKTFKPVWQWR